MDQPKIGIIGAGRLGTTLARLLLKAGYSVQLNHGKNSETSQRVTSMLGNQAALVGQMEVVKNDILILAVRWEHIEDALSPLRLMLKGKILVDATNPFIDKKTLFNTESGINSSLVISSLIPETNIVKAFNSLLAEWLDTELKIPGGKRVMFVSGDEINSKQIVIGIIKKIGFACIDLGGIKTGGSLQQGGMPLSLKNLILLTGDDNE